MADKREKKRIRRAALLSAALFLTLFFVVVVVLLRGPGAPEIAPADETPAQTAAAEEPVAAEPAPEPERPADLRLSELMVKNHTAWRAPDGSFPDWIELYNADSEPVSLEGWRLSDKETGGWALPARSLQPGEYLIVCADGSGRVSEDMLCADFSLSAGETVRLLSPGGSLVDAMSDDAGTANHAVARGEDGALFETRDATPGLPNTRESASAYAASLAPEGPLIISEVVVLNYSTLPQDGQYYDWVELKNISDGYLQLSDYYLSDDEDEPLLWRLPERTLAPGKTILVFCSGDESLAVRGYAHTNFSLDREEEDLFLCTADRRAVDYVYLRNVPVGGSMGRRNDRSGWSCFPAATPNYGNGEAPILIDKRSLRVGGTLEFYNDYDCTLEYLVEGRAPSAELTLDESLYESWITVRATRSDGYVSEDRVYFSKLPVVYIDTLKGISVSSHTTYRVGSMLVQLNGESAEYEYAGSVQIRGRGNTSWTWPKKPYRIKLGRKADLFGMGANKNWVLLANYLDESLLRNTTAQQVAAELGLVSMDSVWVDVVLNGSYIGNYQLCEQVRIDETRVDIFDWEEEAERLAEAVWASERAEGRSIDLAALETRLKENLSWITSGVFSYVGRHYTVSDYIDVQGDISGGYLFELSKEFRLPSRFYCDSGLKVMVRRPDTLYTNKDVMKSVEQIWEDFDAAVRSENGYVETAEGEKHYTELADLDSMVAFWLTQDILGNNDAYAKSRFAYKDVGGPITFGPVWDFDWGCGSLKTPSTGRGWALARTTYPQAFYKEFLDDPLFVVRATEAYWRVRPFLEELTREGGILETETAYLRESGLADQARWDRHATFFDLTRGFEADAELFKQFLRTRIEWFDRQFATIDGFLASVHVSYSASPYEKSDKLSIELQGAREDTVSGHAPADGLVPSGEPLAVTVRVGDAAAVSLEVYVDGLRLETLAVENGLARFSVPAERLDADGRKTVISLIAKDASGATLYRNFASVLAQG